MHRPLLCSLKELESTREAHGILRRRNGGGVNKIEGMELSVVGDEEEWHALTLHTVREKHEK